MSDPLVLWTDIATYLGDPTLNQDRAEQMITDAQILCESVVYPLPAGAALIVKRVAARGYLTITSARQFQLGAADAGFGTQPGPIGGVYLTKYDKADLRRLGGATGGAFSINLLPTDYTSILPPWDVNGEADVATS